MFGADADGNVLVGDVSNSAQQGRKVFNVFCISQNSSRQSLLLEAGALMAHIEDLHQFRVVRKHSLIEVGSKCNTVFAKNRNSSLNEFDLLFCKH